MDPGTAAALTTGYASGIQDKFISDLGIQAIFSERLIKYLNSLSIDINFSVLVPVPVKNLNKNNNNVKSCEIYGFKKSKTTN